LGAIAGTRRADGDRAETGGLPGRDVLGRVADLGGRGGRPVSSPLPGELEQRASLFCLTAERALAWRKEPLEPEPLQTGPGHWLGGPCDEAAAGARAAGGGGRGQPLAGARACLPAARVRVGEELEVALCECGAPRVQAFVDSRVGHPCGAKHIAADALCRQAAVLDVRGCIGGVPAARDPTEGRDERAAAERVVGQEERSV